MKTEKVKILITVKTYPTISKKYGELSCTAGVKEDGAWIRIYPIPFRLLEFTKRYKKYQWLEVQVAKIFQIIGRKVINYLVGTTLSYWI